MKKSKIIVPALGLLLLSTAASVSGTVAWFTANRTFNATVGEFTVVATTGDLACVFTPGVGTANNGGTNSLKVADATVLTHGSLDHTDSKVAYPANDVATKFNEYSLAGAYKATPANVTTDTTGLFAGTDYGADGLSGGSGANADSSIYYALTWEMEFTYTTTSADSYALFLNLDTSKSAVTGVTDTGSGFRIAFMNSDASTGARKVVWADNQIVDRCAYVSAVDGNHDATVTGTWKKLTTKVGVASVTDASSEIEAGSSASGWYTDTGCTVAAASIVAGTKYYQPSATAATGTEMDIVQTATGYATANQLLASDTDSSKIAKITDSGAIEDNAANMDTYYNYFGQFTPGHRTITFLCVAWFEGTDPNINIGHTLDTLTAAMYFETRKLPA